MTKKRIETESNASVPSPLYHRALQESMDFWTDSFLFPVKVGVIGEELFLCSREVLDYVGGS